MDLKRLYRVPIRILILVGLTTVFVGSLVAKQAMRPKPPGATYQGQAFTFNRIQDDIYHAVGTGKLSVGCNASIIVNPNDVIVVDSHISPAAAWALLEELKAITTKPVRYVVNTHWHFDHLHGNQIFPPDVEIIGHQVTRDAVVAGKSKSGMSYEWFVGGLPGQIARLKTQIEATTDAAERARLQDQLVIQENYLAATNAVNPTPPTIAMTDTMTLYRGGREIRLLYLGRGHTAGDVVVFLPKERVVMTGDLMTAGMSYIGDSYPQEWIATLDRLKALGFDVLLPGHGQAYRDKERISYFQAYLKDFWTQAEALKKQGVSAADAAKRMDMRAHATHFPDIKDVGVFPHGVIRVYALLDGSAH